MSKTAVKSVVILAGRSIENMLLEVAALNIAIAETQTSRDGISRAESQSGTVSEVWTS